MLDLCQVWNWEDADLKMNVWHRSRATRGFVVLFPKLEADSAYIEHLISQCILCEDWGHIPGSRRESFTRSMSANNGKWFKKANHVSSAAFNEMINIRADAKAR